MSQPVSASEFPRAPSQEEWERLSVEERATAVAALPASVPRGGGVPHLPLHLSPMGARLGGKPGDCPVTEALSDRLVRLPFYTELSASDQGQVIEAVGSFRP